MHSLLHDIPRFLMQVQVLYIIVEMLKIIYSKTYVKRPLNNRQNKGDKW